MFHDQGKLPARSSPQACKTIFDVVPFLQPVETFEVLNDLVVDRGPSPFVSLLELFGKHSLPTLEAISPPTKLKLSNLLLLFIRR